MGGRWLQLLLRQNRNRSRQPLARLPLLILLTATALALVTLYTFYYTAASSLTKLYSGIQQEKFGYFRLPGLNRNLFIRVQFRQDSLHQIVTHDGCNAN